MEDDRGRKEGHLHYELATAGQTLENEVDFRERCSKIDIILHVSQI